VIGSACGRLHVALLAVLNRSSLLIITEVGLFSVLFGPSSVWGAGPRFAGSATGFDLFANIGG
jgi:hypothetical protein